MSKMVRSVASHVIKGDDGQEVEVDIVDVHFLNLYVRECEEGAFLPYHEQALPFTGVRVRPLAYISISKRLLL